MRRRSLLFGLLTLPLALPLALRGALAGRAAPTTDLAAIRGGWQRLAGGCVDLQVDTGPLELSDAVWRERLTGEQYRVLRNDGTERPHSSPLNGEKRPGLFVCAGCELPLFTSEMKYDSGTGWPSFFTTIPGRVGTRKDFTLVFPRTEYHCIRCGGHHGHVFRDGPVPTGERWCNNGVALTFVPLTGTC